MPARSSTKTPTKPLQATSLPTTTIIPTTKVIPAPTPTPAPAPMAVPAHYILSPRTIKRLEEEHKRTTKTFDRIIEEALEYKNRTLGIGRSLHCMKCRRITPHIFIISRPLPNSKEQELIYECSVPDCKHRRRYGTQIMTQL